MGGNEKEGKVRGKEGRGKGHTYAGNF